MPQNNNSKKLFFAAAMMVFLILSAQAFSQSSSGTLSGIIQDPSKAVMPNVSVSITHVETNIEKTTLSNNAGVYNFQGLQPGLYKVKVENTGFKTIKTELKIEIGAQASKPFSMEIAGAPNETVSVSSSAGQELLETSASTGTVLTPEYLTNMPTTTNDVMSLVNFIGGVVPVSDNPLFDANQQMLAGTAAPGIAVIRDGININEVRWDSGIQTPSRINPELVQEFKVILSPVDAEYGRGAGQIQILTKSGGSAYHGSIVYNAQNHSLDAQGWRSTNYANNWRNQHNYTASFGGPIIKQKLFFFANWDQTISRDRTDVTPSVLTPCARKGIYRYFSGWDSGNAVQVTTSGNAYGGLAKIATVHPDGTPATDTVTMQPNGTTPSTLQLQSVFGKLDDSSRALLDQDPINCSKYDPYTNLGVTSYWESGGATPGLRQLNTLTIPRFSAMMPLPNNYGLASNYMSQYANFYATTNNGGDGLNTAVAKWTQTNAGSQTVYSSGSNPNRKTLNTNINYNYSDRHRLSGNYMVELSGGVGATQLWPKENPDPHFTPADGMAYRRPQQFGLTITSTVRPTMLNEARLGLARTTSHTYSPINSPDKGDSVKKMLQWLVPTDNFPDYKGRPMIVGVGPASSLAGSPSNFTFSPEGGGSSSFFAQTNPPSHPYGSKSSSLIPTFGGSDNRWTITDNFTWMSGAHSIRVGGDLRLTKSYQDSDGTIGFYNNALTYPIAFGGFSDYAIPGWTYPSSLGLVGAQNYNLQPGGGVQVTSTGTQAGMVDLLTYMSGSLGTIRQQYFVNNPFDRTWNDAIGKGETSQIVDMRQKEFSFFAKDDWRVRPNFTVNLGVRWEYYGIPWLANGMTVGLQGGGYSMFGVTGRNIGSWMAAKPVQLDNSYLMKQIFIGPNSPNPSAVLYNQDYNNFGPAVGFSWNMPWLGRGRTVLRAGYQLSYRAVGNAGGQSFGSSLANEAGTAYTQYYRGTTSDTYLSVANLADHIPANKFMDPSIIPLDTLKIKNHGVTYTAYDPNIRTPYTQSINMSITRTIKNNITIDIRYIGTLARKSVGDININTPNFINNGLIDALNAARRGENPALLDQMFKGFSFAQLANVNNNMTAVGRPGGPTGADVVRGKWGTNLANGDFAAIATNIANLNYDKKVTGNLLFGVIPGPIVYINKNFPDLDANEKGSVLRANGFAENYILGNPQLSTATYRSNLIHSNYHSGQAQVQLRPTRGLMFTSTYTFSKTLADQPGGGGFWGGGGWTDPTNRALDYKLSYGAKHQWQNMGMMDLPLGANGYFLRGVQNGIIRRAIEGWQFSWTMRIQNGTPQQISGGTNHLYSGATLMDLVGPKELAPGNSVLEWPAGASQGYYYGTGATSKYVIANDPQCGNTKVVSAGLASSCTLKALFQAVPNGTATPGQGRILLQNPMPGHQGNFSSYVEGIGTINFDMGMTKSVMLTEGKSLNFRVNASNILNHPSPNNPIFQVGGFGALGVTGMKSGNRTFQGNLTIRF
jgi:hypothetical protein